jgi:homocysteine S-methyltransferase
MRQSFLEYLSDRVLVCDGGMGTQLYAKGVFLNRCFDELNLSEPEMVREIHQEYFWAGADILESNTFGANAIKLEPHGLAERLVDINAAGVTLAREVAGEAAYVAGSVGPLGVRLAPDGKLSIDEAKGLFAAQIEALAGAQADLLSLETFSSVNELQAALLAVREVCDLPVMAQANFDHEGNCLDGTKAEDFARMAEQWGADIIGVNCGVGPQVMLETIERIAGSIEQKMVAQPNAGQPRRFEGRNLYLSSPEYLASYARRFIDVGVQIVGGCCGTTPAHIRAIREVVRTIGSVRKH